MRQLGTHPPQAAFGSLGMADIQGKVDRAREGIMTYTEALATFGTLEAALAPTPIEAMLEEAVSELPPEDYWRWSTERLAKVFVLSVSPTCVAELQYWGWLHRIRKHMHTIEHSDDRDYPEPSYFFGSWTTKAITDVMTTMAIHSTASNDQLTI